MPPKKNPSSEDFEDLKKALDILTEKVSDVLQQQKIIMKLADDVKNLQLLNNEKDKKIMMLENRIDDLEQYSRINDVIITGLKTKPRSYARALTASNGVELNDQDEESVEQQVITFLNSKGVILDKDSIEACHSLPQRNKQTKPTIIISFANRKHKTGLLKQGKMLRGTDVFLNEHLTKKNAMLAREARLLRKQKKILSTWSNNCKVFVKTNGTPEESKVVLIRSMEDLEKYRQ